MVFVPLTIGLVIAHLSQGKFDEAKLYAYIFILLSLVFGLTLPLIKYIGMIGEGKAYQEISAEYFRALIRSDMEYFSSHQAGYLTSAMIQYQDSSMRLIRALRDKYMGTILKIALPLVVIAFIDAWLWVAAILLSAVQAIYMFWSSKRLDPYRTASREAHRNTSGLIADSTSNIITVKSSAREKIYTDKMRILATNENTAYAERYTLQAKYFMIREIFTIFFFAALMTLTVWRTSTGQVDIVGAVLVINYLTTILVGTTALADDMTEHDDFIDNIMPALKVLERKNKIQDPKKPVEINEVKGDLQFRSVSFHYDDANGKTDVLENFSLSIPAGQKLGIVGLSGAGKSTLAKLILRFNDVTEGEILLDGVGIRSLRQNDLRRNIAYVPQEPLLFHDSIRHNLSLARQDITEEEMISALKSAHAWEFVSKLSDKLDSVVGERGIKLSGGQKQRIVIARAILQDAPIMLLDEATSALDSESEQMIKKSFSTILKGKTSIVIAHRLSTLSEMDRIIVIDKGKLVEDGTHQELLNADSVYAKLWKHQQRIFDECKIDEGGL